MNNGRDALRLWAFDLSQKRGEMRGSSDWGLAKAAPTGSEGFTHRGESGNNGLQNKEECGA